MQPRIMLPWFETAMSPMSPLCPSHLPSRCSVPMMLVHCCQSVGVSPPLQPALPALSASLQQTLPAPAPTSDRVKQASRAGPAWCAPKPRCNTRPLLSQAMNTPQVWNTRSHCTARLSSPFPIPWIQPSTAAEPSAASSPKAWIAK